MLLLRVLLIRKVVFELMNIMVNVNVMILLLLLLMLRKRLWVLMIVRTVLLL